MENDKVKAGTTKIRNVLSFMESSILYDFLILDHFLKNKEKIVSENNEFKVGTLEFNKIVLCPLIMDFGSSDDAWRKTIVDTIKNHENVYTDFLCNTHGDEYYEKLNKTLTGNSDQKLDDRVLFGSDFMINLIWLKSYNEYLKVFFGTTHLNDDMKFKFTNINSERFLFG